MRLAQASTATPRRSGAAPAKIRGDQTFEGQVSAVPWTRVKMPLGTLYTSSVAPDLHAEILNHIVHGRWYGSTVSGHELTSYLQYKKQMPNAPGGHPRHAQKVNKPAQLALLEN